MRLRIILPPNLERCAPRDAIPTKIEVVQDNGAIIQPEKLAMDAFGQLDDAGRVAAFNLLQWGGGKMGSFVQLSREQLDQLLTALQGQPSFFWANSPKQAITWQGTTLPNVSPHITQKSSSSSSSSSPTSSSPSPITNNPEPLLEEQEEDYDKIYSDYLGNPLHIDGSTSYLAVRLPSKEHPFYNEIRELLISHRFKLEPKNRKWWLRDRHQTLNFIGEIWGDLEDRYYAEFSDNFLARVKDVQEADIKTDVSEGHNGYSISVSIKAGQASDQEVSQNLNTGRHYIESEGKVYLLKKSKLKKLHELQQSLAETPDAPLLHRARYSVPYVRVPQVEEELELINPNFEAPATWRQRSIALKDLTTLVVPPLPEDIDATLRPYQKIGVSWLHHLFKNKLGGILADEMGLGKTLQAIALLASLKLQTSRTLPSLVVCPASLVENWRRETEKFAPQLKVFVNHGTSRIKKPSDIAGYDLVITSYGTLIRDQKHFAAADLRCVIGDEAQHIKNKRTRNAKAISSLNAQGRILLTGTPVENSIDDLMSLLDYIMPGSWKGIPAGARGDDRQWHEQRIKEQAGPYILRRNKITVAPELPEKLEQVVFLEMTPEQKTTYEKARKYAESEIAALEKSGASEGTVRMKTLTQLLRLRQVCCDPRILDDTLAPESSSKLASFLELLQESIDGGHRILVFSQFVSVLTLLKEQLKELEVPFCYIDGKTRNRMAEVDRFNDSDDIPVFLISLKAGGTGLNLTAADTVIHYDPWWNPAAEAQATDRAHRIGQTKVVTSYKLIVADSVEEKVLELQGQKRKLLEDIFEASEAANSKISLSDMKSLL